MNLTTITKLQAKRIASHCGSPESYFFDSLYYGASLQANIRRVMEYAACVRKVLRSPKKAK